MKNKRILLVTQYFYPENFKSNDLAFELQKRGYQVDAISLLQAVDTAVSLQENKDYGTPVPYYTDENVSTKVVKLIQSYTSVVNKMVWRKE
jgi:UDP-N-acetylglucosamine 2-epimerase